MAPLWRTPGGWSSCGIQFSHPRANLHRLSAENLLSKPSRSRIDDLLYRVVQRRYVEPGPHVIPALKGLVSDQRAFREACYYETSRDDDLLAAFAGGPMWEWWQQGRLSVDVDDVLGWLHELAKAGKVPIWSDSVRVRSSHKDCCRHFEILESWRASPGGGGRRSSRPR